MPMLCTHTQPPPLTAFNKDILLSDRWLLGGCPRSAEAVWHDVLKMTIPKQKLFMDRGLFVFEITQAKAGKAQVLRLSSQQWMAEADVACLAGDILERMESHRNSDNILLFPPDTLKMVKQRFVEGTFGFSRFDISSEGS